MPQQRIDEGQAPDAPVLVTGVAGLIGSAVARVLDGAGVRVIGVDDLSAGDPGRLTGLSDQFRFVEADVRDRKTLDELLLEGPGTILHLAARVGVRTVLGDPRACELENIEGTQAIVDALERAAAAFPAARGGFSAAPARVVAASTSEVYAESAAPLREDSAKRPRIAEGRWRYAASKRLAEDVLDGYSQRSGVPVTHLRFFNVVGPGQDASSGMVMPRFIERARRGAPIEVHGDGRQIRTFAHVDAVARDVASIAVPRTARLQALRGPLNVGGTARTSILGLARMVAERSRAAGHSAAPIEFVDPTIAVGSNFEEVVARVPDLGRLRRLGLGLGHAGLETIVDDMLARHRASERTSRVPVGASTAELRDLGAIPSTVRTDGACESHAS